jgi:indolepyruvate ferredoxin oxidoreductase alpha subunit
MLRITTRLAHSRAGIKRIESRNKNEVKLPEDLRQFVLLPAIARKRYRALLKAQDLFEQASENSSFNKYIDGPDKSLGIIVCGIAFNYLLENYPERVVPHPVLKIGQYPLPKKMIERLYNECEEILVLEDGYPIVEEST